jgi:hypothetical protein
MQSNQLDHVVKRLAIQVRRKLCDRYMVYRAKVLPYSIALSVCFLVAVTTQKIGYFSMR